MSAKNYNTGKMRSSLVLGDMPSAFAEMVKLREAGAVKYDRMNWAESIGTDDAKRFLAENLDSILRHLMAMYKGEELDPETGCHHASSVAVRACFAMEYWAHQSQEDGPVGDGASIGENSEALSGSSPEPSPLDLDPLADFRKKVTKSLYDWSKIDSEYKWCATGPQGTARAFEYKPFIEGEHWEAMQGWASDIFSTTPDLAESWQDSLEERPKS